MIPYTRSMVYNATQTGWPVMRMLTFVYPNDASLVDAWDEYMYGDALLVAPVTTAGATSRSIYLPAGEWTDYNDKATHYSGPTTLPPPLRWMSFRVTSKRARSFRAAISFGGTTTGRRTGGQA
jgi:alpha-D-xyloside xylohydrolase